MYICLQISISSIVCIGLYNVLSVTASKVCVNYSRKDFDHIYSCTPIYLIDSYAISWRYGNLWTFVKQACMYDREPSVIAERLVGWLVACRSASRLLAEVLLSVDVASPRSDTDYTPRLLVTPHRVHDREEWRNDHELSWDRVNEWVSKLVSERCASADSSSVNDWKTRIPRRQQLFVFASGE